MKSIYSLLLLFFLQISYSQSGIIKGTVIDEINGKPLSGVEVKLIELNKTTISDSNGIFTFIGLNADRFSIKFTIDSYESKIISEVDVVLNDATTVTVSLLRSDRVLNEVVIKTTKMKAESVKSLLLQQKNSINVSDGISAETIKKTPDKNTSDVIKRISGASIQENKFVVVRGLNDRYNACFLNGSPLPSSEPDRKAFSFDIFPSNMIDNLIISKTATPDLPADFAGGVIQINTKNIPDNNFQTLSIGSGYNTVTTNKNQLYYNGGKSDWLGIDDGTRALPNGFPDATSLQSMNGLQRAEYAKLLTCDWSLHNKNFSPNISLQYSLGQKIKLNASKTLGVLFSVSYNKTNNFNETIFRGYEDQGPDVAPILSKDFLDKTYSEQYLLGSLANFSFKFNNNNAITFKNIYSINSEDKVIDRQGPPSEALSDNPTKIVSTVRWFTSNTIYSGQLNGEHYFSKLKFKINWNTSLSTVDRSIPNMRRNVYVYNDDLPLTASIPSGNAGPDYGGGMFFSENKEKILNAKIDFVNDIGSTSRNEIKYGFSTQKRMRDFFARQLQYNKLESGSISFDGSLLNQPNESIFSPSNIGLIAPNTGGFTIYDGTKYYDKYDASSSLQAAYIMSDNKLNKFRFVWGIRVENYHQLLDTDLTATTKLSVDNKQTDFLPSINFIYSLNSKQNLRISYSKTLNRPEFRELAPFGFYDFTTQFFTSGNPDLQIAKIQNGDLRYEIYPGKNQLFSISAFYKKFENPIELIAGVNNNEVRYENSASAINYGYEMEFRTVLSSLFNYEKSYLLNNLTVFSNLSIINSKVDVSNLAAVSDSRKSRQMQGQSPYVFNAGLQFADAELGWSFAMNANRVGNRIAVVGNTEVKPDLWEKSRTFLDCQLAKSFLKKKMELKLNVQNILGQDLIFYENRDLGKTNVSGFNGIVNTLFTGDSQNKNGYNSDEDDLIRLTKYGRTFSLILTYNF
jgi:outer membrane receptor protein involved in Fe transport